MKKTELVNLKDNKDEPTNRNTYIEQDSKLFESERGILNDEGINLKTSHDMLNKKIVTNSLKNLNNLTNQNLQGEINTNPNENDNEIHNEIEKEIPYTKTSSKTGAVFLANEMEAEQIEFKGIRSNNNNNNKILSSNTNISLINQSVHKLPERRETYLYDNLGIKVRGFNYKNMNIIEESDPLQKRRYNKFNIEKGKNFFKIRYIKEKFQELMNMNNKNIIDKMESESIYTSNNRESLKSDNKENLNNLPLNVILNEDKNAIKFNSLFLQKLEKAIFSFNLKKYEDSYTYLLGSGIVKDELEFGELLLVTTGFDKYIVGDFLSKEKTPNKEKKVLKGFMDSLDFRGIKFLDSFRFLLSRLNLPKDAGLILEIIDAFSQVFFEDNKHQNYFKDTTAIYLLSSSVLALNTMFSRSDIPNMKVLRREDFVKMNKDVDKNILENIYNELKEKKLDIIYDYNEQVYKRISIEVKSIKDFFQSEEAFNKVNSENNFQEQKNDVGKNERNTHSKNIDANKHMENIENNFINTNKEFYKDKDNQLSENSEMKGEEIITMLKIGEVFTKYGQYGDPHPRIVKLAPDEKKLIWFTPGSCSIFKSQKYIEIHDIKDVYIGVQSSKNLEKFKIPPDYDSNCFSIQCGKRTLDLRKDDETTIKKWFHAIKFMLKRTKSMQELKNKNNLKDTINKKEIVGDIWKTEILPNWHVYRKFVIVKASRNGNLIQGFNDIYKENNKKNKEKFAKIIKNNKKDEKILDDKDKSEFLYLWTLGVPDWLRKKIWLLIIGNESGITENLFNFHLQQVEPLIFEDLIKILGGGIIAVNHNGSENNNLKNGNNPIVSNYNTISLTNHNTIKLKSKLHVSDDPILNEIINDVVKISNKFVSEIKDEKIDILEFMADLYKVVRVFTLFRPDITYSKQICYISAILLLNSENYYSAFVSLVNFSIPSFVMKFLTRDEIYIRLRLDFFEKLMKNYLPSVYKHFVKLDVTTSLYFFNWIENIFIKTFKYETLLRIWDIYLIKGEVFLYEIGLCILKIQEKEIIRYTVKDILKNLKKMSININEDEFFDTLQEIDISEDYKKLIYETSLAREKGLLFQSFMIEWI